MNYKLINRTIIAFAFSCIISGIIGYVFAIEKYYLLVDLSKKEVPFYFYKDFGEDLTFKELGFNIDLAIAVGLVSFGTCFLVLSIVEHFQKKINTNTNL